MIEDGWVTDPKAIETVIALGLAVGDEIVVNTDEMTEASHPTGSVLVVTDVDGSNWSSSIGDDCWWHAPMGKIVCLAKVPNDPASPQFFFAEKNITAWRRPVRTKK